MQTPATHLDTLLRLETQHEDLLQRLDELDKQVIKVLAEYQVHVGCPPEVDCDTQQ